MSLECPYEQGWEFYRSCEPVRCRAGSFKVSVVIAGQTPPHHQWGRLYGTKKNRLDLVRLGRDDPKKLYLQTEKTFDQRIHLDADRQRELDPFETRDARHRIARIRQ